MHTHKKTSTHVLLSFLLIAIVITGLSLIVYAAVQQNYRESLNDPQIQMAEDAANALADGKNVTDVIPDSRTDIITSLLPWIAVYDETGRVIGSSGMLNQTMPQPPQGIFDAARSGDGKDTLVANENRITWQPAPGVRQAIVVVHYSGKQSGFVVAGRNMREVESRESRLSMFILIAWLVMLIGALTFRFLMLHAHKRHAA